MKKYNEIMRREKKKQKQNGKMFKCSYPLHARTAQSHKTIYFKCMPCKMVFLHFTDRLKDREKKEFAKLPVASGALWCCIAIVINWI